MFHIKSKEDYELSCQKAAKNLDQFWGEIAQNYFWFEKWKKVDNCNLEKAQISWFEGGKTNISYNCLDRHLEKNGDKIALIFEGNDVGDKSEKYTYKELHEKVCQLANLLIAKGIKKGDRVCIYMPMIPQGLIAMLACARIGAVHLVVFAGFSSKALAQRIQDSGAKMVICADLLYRGEKIIALHEMLALALEECPSVESVLLFKRGEKSVNFLKKTYIWQEEIDNFSVQNEAEILDALDDFFILYTSGSTGKPKGILHRLGGYMTYAGYSFKNVFQYRDNEIFFCSADIGWITGHSYLVYGPLLNAATILMFEGVPTHPTPARFWQVIEKHKVNIFYTAPTAIRALMQKGEEHLQNCDLSSLRVLGTVGEPINEEAWQWFYEKIGNKKCPIVDTWWQTETGGIMISSLAGVLDSKPSYAGFPLPGIFPILLDDDKNEVTKEDEVGNLCMAKSWPAAACGVWGDEKKFFETYYKNFSGFYLTGDGAFKTKGGIYRIIGRLDDVIKVSGHRLGSAEIENAVNQHQAISESAVIGAAHEIKGEVIYVFAILRAKNSANKKLEEEISNLIVKEIGAIARPERVLLVDDLPKTRSGKIMRRILKKIIAAESDFGDVSTLVNPDVVAKLQEIFLAKA
jgi:acetyl-CoA synthetase